MATDAAPVTPAAEARDRNPADVLAATVARLSAVMLANLYQTPTPVIEAAADVMRDITPLVTGLHTVLAESTARTDEAVRERDEARAMRRWNFERIDGLVLVCRGLHDKTEPCSDHDERFVPEEDLAAATARIAALEAALEPFSTWLDALDTEFADHADDVIVGGIPGATVTFGDLRAAHAALQPNPGGSDA